MSALLHVDNAAVLQANSQQAGVWLLLGGSKCMKVDMLLLLQFVLDFTVK